MGEAAAVFWEGGAGMVTAFRLLLYQSPVFNHNLRTTVIHRLDGYALKRHRGQSDAAADDFRVLREKLNQSQCRIRGMSSPLLPALQRLRGDTQQSGKDSLGHRNLAPYRRQSRCINLGGIFGDLDSLQCQLATTVSNTLLQTFLQSLKQRSSWRSAHCYSLPLRQAADFACVFSSVANCESIRRSADERSS